VRKDSASVGVICHRIAPLSGGDLIVVSLPTEFDSS